MNVKLSKRVNGVAASKTLAISAKAQKMKAEGIFVVNFGVGEPDFSTPDFVANAAIKAIYDGKTKYTPVAGITPLREAVARELEKSTGLKYSASEVVVASGAKQPIYNVVSALTEEGDEVIIPSPYWVTYPEIVKYCGATSVFVETKEENGFKITAEELEKAITPNTRLIILNSPCNPTGAVYKKEELEKIAEVVKKHDGIFVLSDEIYKNLVYDGEKHVSIATIDGMRDRTIIVDGVSKSYAMTGWRLGWSVAPEIVSQAMTRAQSHITSCANSIAQYAALAALTDEKDTEAFIAEMNGIFERRRNLAVKLLSENGIKYIKPHGAFYLFLKISDTFGKRSSGGRAINSAEEFCDALITENGVATVSGEAFGAGEYVRISYALDEEKIAEGIKRIAEFIRLCK